MSIATAALQVKPGWLRGREFDLTFTLGIAALALASGLAVVWQPRLFPLIFLADLWLLGYHHVIATFTRLCFDRDSFQRHKFLVLGLPPLVLGGCLLAAWGVGLWILPTVYLYWQWFHYARQSWGISQAYRGRSDGLVNDGLWFSQIALYALPVWGILYRSHQAPETFLFMELRTIPVDGLVVDVAAAVAVVAIGAWLATRAVAFWRGRLPLAHTLYMLSHFVVFYVAYIGIEDVTYGWLVVNVWHNAQYILFVWLQNNRRFKDGIDPRARFLSAISQRSRMLSYFAVCLGISTALYWLFQSYVSLLIAPVILYQAINFHHYIVDAIIWSRRRGGAGPNPSRKAA